MLTTRLQRLFAALILARAAHSVEEYGGKLYESSPPARFVSGLIAEDQQRGFLIAPGECIPCVTCTSSQLC
jgi:hypothetical protein